MAAFYMSAITSYLYPSLTDASERNTFEEIQIKRGINPATISIKGGGSLSFYEFIEPRGFAESGFLAKYYVVYTVPSPTSNTQNARTVALINNYALGEIEDHFESSSSGGDCEDKKAIFFPNGTKIIVVSLDRKNGDLHDRRAGDGPGTVVMKIYIGMKVQKLDSEYQFYYFEIKSQQALDEIMYCIYDDVRPAVAAALSKYEDILQ